MRSYRSCSREWFWNSSARAAVRARIAEDLDLPGALGLVDRWAADVAAGVGSDPDAPGQVRVLLDTLLGVDLS